MRIDDRWTAAAMLALACASGASGAPRDISELIQPIFAAHHVPALVGAIVELDGATAIGAAGVRKIGSPQPFTVDDQIHLGSDTKAMTAALIAMLIEHGDLAYDTTMAACFPDLAPRMDATASAITVEQLLNHRAGLPANVDWAGFARGEGPVEAQRRRIVETVLSRKPEKPPGSTYVYSNVGYMLLGAIVEAKTKQPWETAIGERLFKSLDMTSAGFGAPGTRGEVDQPWGHLIDQRGRLIPTQSDNPPPLGPAGTVHCTMADWAKFIAWTLRCEQGDTQLLSRAAHERLLRPIEGSVYAGGWLLTERPWAGGPVLTHAGSNTCWYCVAWLAPRRGFAVLAATNVAGDDAQRACDEVAAALIRAHERDGPTTSPSR